MTQPTYPGVYVQETPGAPQEIAGVPTSIAAFAGRAVAGPLDRPSSVASFAEFERLYGELAGAFPMSSAVHAFFENGGTEAIICRVERAADLPGDRSSRTGIYMLENVPIFNLLCIPGDQCGADVPVTILQSAAQYCYERRAMLLLDPPATWTQLAEQGAFEKIRTTDFGIDGDYRRNAAVYFPKIKDVPVCGAIAGVYAATDASRGVWHAPAGGDAGLAGVTMRARMITSTFRFGA